MTLVRVIALDYGGYAVAFQVSQWCRKGRRVARNGFMTADDRHGLQLFCRGCRGG
jgi:hypothetical protein